MNALKYLAVDRSLVTGRDVVGRFQMRNDCLLPQFNGSDSDRRDETSAAAAPSRWRRLFDWLTGGAVSPPAPLRVAAVSPNGEAPQVNRSPVAAKAASRAQVTVEVPPAKLEQAEFRFEKVRVVCNDLHDADFEIVTLPARKRREAAPVLPQLATA